LFYEQFFSTLQAFVYPEDLVYLLIGVCVSVTSIIYFRFLAAQAFLAGFCLKKVNYYFILKFQNDMDFKE